MVRNLRREFFFRLNPATNTIPSIPMADMPKLNCEGAPVRAAWPLPPTVLIVTITSPGSVRLLELIAHLGNESEFDEMEADYTAPCIAILLLVPEPVQ